MKYSTRKDRKLKNPKNNKKKNRKTQKIPINRMNCSPMVKNKTPVKNSCFTDEVLLKIKEEYNSGKPESEQIQETNIDDIWHELRRRLRCKKEKCWLNQIKNTNLRQQIEEYIFAPKQPPEWKQDPNTWLSNFDILNVLKQYEKAYPTFEFIGPTPIDFDTRLSDKQCVTRDLCQFYLNEQKKNGKTKIGIIFNLSPHNKSGSHWVSLFIDLEEKHIFYFDSNGAKIPNEVFVFVNRICNEGEQMVPPILFQMKENKIEHQSGNTECGMYSLFFIITMLTCEVEMDRKRKIEKMSLEDKIKLFSSVKIPDEYVEQFRYTFFNL